MLKEIKSLSFLCFFLIVTGGCGTGSVVCKSFIFSMSSTFHTIFFWHANIFLPYCHPPIPPLIPQSTHPLLRSAYLAPDPPLKIRFHGNLACFYGIPVQFKSNVTFPTLLSSCVLSGAALPDYVAFTFHKLCMCMHVCWLFWLSKWGPSLVLEQCCREASAYAALALILDFVCV